MQYPCEERHAMCQFARCIAEHPLKVIMRECEGKPNITIDNLPALRSEKVLEVECAFYECPQHPKHSGGGG